MCVRNVVPSTLSFLFGVNVVSTIYPNKCAMRTKYFLQLMLLSTIYRNHCPIQIKCFLPYHS